MGFREIAPNSARRFDIPVHETWNPAMPEQELTMAHAGGADGVIAESQDRSKPR
jgi:hypothetical protein